MSDKINSQFEFFQAVQLDADGSLLVKVIGGGGGTGDNDYTIAANLSGTTLSFDRTDEVNAFSVDLGPIAGGGFGVNLDAGFPGSILMSPNYECGLVNSIAVDTIDGGGV